MSASEIVYVKPSTNDHHTSSSSPLLNGTPRLRLSQGIPSSSSTGLRRSLGMMSPMIKKHSIVDMSSLVSSSTQDHQHHRHGHGDDDVVVVDKPVAKEASPTKKITSLLVWFLFNSLTLILNKSLFSTIGFHYPLTLTAVHMLSCFVMAFGIIKVLGLVPQKTLSRDEIITKILPLSFVFCANIVFGNFSIRFIPISFMQTVKSSVPVFTVILNYLILGKKSTKQVLLALIPVVGGVALASITEVNFVMSGFICAIMGSILTAMQAVMLHSSAVRLDAVNLIMYTSPISLAFLILPVLYFEMPLITTEWEGYGQLMPACWLIISGMVAFALNYASFIVSGVLTALTMTVAGNFKAVINIVASVLVFGNKIGLVNWAGCMVAVAGVMWYNHLMMSKKKDDDVSNTQHKK
eukprot:TRINITY_DN3071_c0_g1_i2.p1 TRINITY_DN3071_c0_g1~~TRINITY_DN3071_c0_g1_i2.p1  ORF type:complete len:408 (+),score=97.90 TRINITY_DN3071_c0_g1_i2:172-1395(+)